MKKLYVIKKTKDRITNYFYGGQMESHPAKKHLVWGKNPFAAQIFKTLIDAEIVKSKFDTGGRVVCLGDPASLRREP